VKAARPSTMSAVPMNNSSFITAPPWSGQT